MSVQHNKFKSRQGAGLTCGGPGTHRSAQDQQEQLNYVAVQDFTHLAGGTVSWCIGTTQTLLFCTQNQPIGPQGHIFRAVYTITCWSMPFLAAAVASAPAPANVRCPCQCFLPATVRSTFLMSAVQLPTRSASSGVASTATVGLTLKVLQLLCLLCAGQAGTMYHMVWKRAAVVGPSAILTCDPDILSVLLQSSAQHMTGPLILYTLLTWASQYFIHDLPLAPGGLSTPAVPSRLTTDVPFDKGRMMGACCVGGGAAGMFCCCLRKLLLLLWSLAI